MTAKDSIEPLVSHPREQYLRKEETRIRSAAIAILASGPDTNLRASLDAVLHAEDLYEIHAETAKYYTQRGQTMRTATHTRYAAQAHQLKLRALDQLSHHVI